jgi:hypothetical protein
MGDAEQLATLPAEGRMHREPGDTELAAAISMKPHTASLRAKVLELLREAGARGLTDDEGAQLLQLRHRLPYVDRLTFGRRRQELCIAGLAYDCGLRRLSQAHRRAIVWRADPPDIGPSEDLS